MDLYAKVKDLLERVELLEQIAMENAELRVKLATRLNVEGQISDALRERIEKLEAIANAEPEEVFLEEPVAAHGASEIVEEVEG
jgi:hypothetical protein